MFCVINSGKKISSWEGVYSTRNSNLLEMSILRAFSSIYVITVWVTVSMTLKRQLFLGKLKGLGHRYWNSMFSFGISFIWCLFKSTSINGKKKFQQTTFEEGRRSACLCSPLRSLIGTTASWFYPECNICSKFWVWHNSSRVRPYSIQTLNVVNAIKAAVAVKNIKLYDEVKYLDLIAREFKVHKYCYQDFTNGFTSGVASVKKGGTPQNSPHHPIYEKGDFDKVFM